MKNSKTMNKAIDAAYKKIMAMPKDKFMKELKKHENGPFSRLLIEAGIFGVTGIKERE